MEPPYQPNPERLTSTRELEDMMKEAPPILEEVKVGIHAALS
jgi:hypothetical protein